MENADARDNFVSGLYERSVKDEKNYVLNKRVEPKYARMHKDADIHLHDLEGYRFVYNCYMPALQDILDPEKFVLGNDFGKMMEVFEKIKSLICSLAVCQTGGIGFANFDIDIADVLEKLCVPFSERNRIVMSDLVTLFLKWVNTTRTRYCREPYYISLNLGLAMSEWGRFVTKSILKAYFEQPIDFERPNIIFKVKKGVNADAVDPNHDLFLQALHCTAHRMVPTYLLLDSGPNRGCDPEKLGIMGCRTRVYQNSCGPEQTIGRGNIAYVSINLPRIALQSSSVDDFMKKLREKVSDCENILMERAGALMKTNKLGFVFENHLWNEVCNLDDLLMQGTLSVGFIGLSETVEIQLRLEGKFHALCNGGSISYVEFNDAPMDNVEALEDLVAYATAQGVSYFGMNFPLDICGNCGHKGTFDDCPKCGSKKIKRIRRVSGYLEDLDYFTSGKKREVAKRRANEWKSR